MKPIIYSSTDDKAPQLNITAGSLRVILKACLATGYGSKAAAGWEMVYEDAVTNKMAIRSKNIASLKSVLVVDDNAADTATVTAFIDWDNTNNQGKKQYSTGYFVKQWTTGFIPRWVILATDKFFYLFIQSESSPTNMRIMSGFGDVNSFNADYYSVLLASASKGYEQTNAGYSAVDTNVKLKASFPNALFIKSSTSTKFGDRAASDTTTNSKEPNAYVSNIAIFSRFALYLLIDNCYQPAFELPGMLMPFTQINGWQVEDDIVKLINQIPYKNPLLGMYQPWHGRIWLHTDDW